MKDLQGNAFSIFFRKFPKLFLAGLMFSVPLAAVTAILILIGYLTGLNNIIIWGLSIIPASPLLAGLCMVIRKTAVEKKDVELAKTFLEAVKANFKLFLVHGVFIYLVTLCTFFAILYYGVMAASDIVYGSVLSIYLLFTAILTAVLFYAPLMTITYELRLRDIYKNSFLLVFGKIGKNLLTLLMILLVSAAAFFAIIYSNGIRLWISVGATAALLPLLFFYISIPMVSKGMQEAIGSFISAETAPEVIDDSEEVENAIQHADKGSDYVYVNGRMIKVNNDK